MICRNGGDGLWRDAGGLQSSTPGWNNKRVTCSRSDIPLKICRQSPQNLCSLKPLVYDLFQLGMVSFFFLCVASGILHKIVPGCFFVKMIGVKYSAENGEFLLVLQIMLSFRKFWCSAFVQNFLLWSLSFGLKPNFKKIWIPPLNIPKNKQFAWMGVCVNVNTLCSY